MGNSFIDDEEKMLDFVWLNKKQFLESYSYLTSEDWNATATEVLKRCKKGIDK